MTLTNRNRIFAFPLFLCIAGLSIWVEAAIAKEDADYHYKGTLKIVPKSGLIQANWDINITDTKNNSITFLLRNTIKQVDVSGPDLVSYEMNNATGLEDFTSVSISLKPSASTRRLRMSYSTVLIPEPMDNLINAIEPERVELNVDSFWFPIDASFSKMLTVELDVLIGEGWQGVTTGRHELINGGIRVINHTPQIDIAFTLSKNFNVTRSAGFTVYDQRKHHDGVDTLIKTASQCRQFLNDRFGQQLPLPAGKLLITNRPSSGYARENYIVFTDISNTKPAPLTRFVCHEFAHFWSRGGNFNTVDNWINESFAEYLGSMAVREFLGEDSFAELMGNMRNQLDGKEVPHIWKQGDTARAPYLVNYRKGPLVLARLEQQLGRDKFLAFIQELFKSREKTTPQLLSILERVAGKEAREEMVLMLAE